MKRDPLDTLFSKYIKLKAGGLCEYCGQPPKSLYGYHCHHGVVKRRYLNTRYEPDNAIALCKHCHDLFHDFSSIEQGVFLKRIGSKRMEELEIIARTYHKMGKERRATINQSLKEKIERLEEK